MYVGPCLPNPLYYVLFIDDFSRKAWIYVMKAKSETFCKFQEFKALVENQTSRHIHSLRSDNGGEFESNAFNSSLQPTTEWGCREKE